MLSCLRIRNLAIIDSLEISFGPGLNVVTGETGAGKSILIGALGLVLGDKAHADLVRTGESQAEIEALFELEDPASVTRHLERGGLGDEDEPAASAELVVRRVISREGRSRAYVNGRLVTLAQLERIARGLASVSSQHEHHSLLDAKSHLGQLDAFGGLLDDVARVGASYDALQRASVALADARALLAGKTERLDLLSFQLHEIDAVGPRPGELAELRVERERLRHADRLLRAAGGAEQALYGRDGSISEELGAIGARLREAMALDPALEPIVSDLESASVELVETARALERYARKVALDPERLAELDERLHALGRLVRKYADDAEAPEAALLDRRARIAEELASLDLAEDTVATLERARGEARDAALAAARALSAGRAEAARALSRRVTEELRTLGMAGASFEVSVRALEPSRGASESSIDGVRLSRSGIDLVEMMLVPNVGEEARPLARIASGGELSRVLLALKCASLPGGASASGRVEGRASLSIFDEVDAGVGGAIAETIGQKLREVARGNQVLAITHLGPIAVYADHHFRVQKSTAAGRTRSEIVPLGDAERVEEIARMVGGLAVTKKTREVAAELLRAASR